MCLNHPELVQLDGIGTAHIESHRRSDSLQSLYEILCRRSVSAGEENHVVLHVDGGERMVAGLSSPVTSLHWLGCSCT